MVKGTVLLGIGGLYIIILIVFGISMDIIKGRQKELFELVENIKGKVSDIKEEQHDMKEYYEAKERIRIFKSIKKLCEDNLEHYNIDTVQCGTNKLIIEISIKVETKYMTKKLLEELSDICEYTIYSSGNKEFVIKIIF